MGFFSGISHAVGKVGSFIKDRGSSIASGAAAGGSMGGPWGALAGGVLGGVTGKGKTSGMVGSFGGLANGIMSSMAGSKGDTSSGVLDALGGMMQNAGGMADMLGGTQRDDGSTKSATEMGRDTRDYLKAAFPELNPWERSGAGGTMSGTEMASQDTSRQQMQNAITLQKMNNDTAIRIAGMNNDKDMQVASLNNATSAQNAGLQSQTSRLNTADQVKAQNSLIEANKARLEADTKRILADTSLTPARQEQLIASAAAGYGAANVSSEQVHSLVQDTRAKTMSNDAGNPRYPGKVASEINAGGTLVSDWVDSAYSHVKHWMGDDKKSGGVQGSTAPRKTPVHSSGPTYAVPGASSAR